MRLSCLVDFLFLCAGSLDAVMSVCFLCLFVVCGVFVEFCNGCFVLLFVLRLWVWFALCVGLCFVFVLGCFVFWLFGLVFVSVLVCGFVVDVVMCCCCVVRFGLCLCFCFGCGMVGWCIAVVVMWFACLHLVF